MTSGVFEEHFEKNHIVLVPADPKKITQWRLKVVNESARNKSVDFGKLCDYDDQILEFKTEFRPAASFLSLLVNRRDRVNGCDKYYLELTTKKLFNTFGKWVRDSMLLVFIKMTDDVDSEDLAFCLGEPDVATSVAEEKMDELEELEVARLCLPLKDGDEDEDTDEEEED